MDDTQLGHVIARREYDLDGCRAVVVLVGQPFPIDDGVNYFCPYQIVGIGEGQIRRAGGVDAVQALCLALQAIATRLYASDEYKNRRLAWNGMRNLGLPVPSTITDLVPPENE